MNNVKIKFETAKSKKGTDYEYLSLTIGEYEGRLYPSRAERAYIKSVINEKARRDFQEALLEAEESED